MQRVANSAADCVTGERSRRSRTGQAYADGDVDALRSNALQPSEDRLACEAELRDNREPKPSALRIIHLVRECLIKYAFRNIGVALRKTGDRDAGDTGFLKNLGLHHCQT